MEAGGFADPLRRARFPLVVLQGETAEELALSAKFADVHLLRARAPDVLTGLIEGLDTFAQAAGRELGYALLQPILARESAAEARRDFAHSGLPDETLVGSWDEVAQQLAGLAALGFGRLILTADQQLEGAYAAGQQVLPRLRQHLATRAKAA